MSPGDRPAASDAQPERSCKSTISSLQRLAGEAGTGDKLVHALNTQDASSTTTPVQRRHFPERTRGRIAAHGGCGKPFGGGFAMAPAPSPVVDALGEPAGREAGQHASDRVSRSTRIELGISKTVQLERSN